MRVDGTIAMTNYPLFYAKHFTSKLREGKLLIMFFHEFDMLQGKYYTSNVKHADFEENFVFPDGKYYIPLLFHITYLNNKRYKLSVAKPL